MLDPVFVRSGRGYASYTDFWRLVELSGFSIIKPSQINFDSDTLYIWAEMDVDFMVPVHDHAKETRRARTAFWYLERPDRRASEKTDACTWWKASLDQTLELVDTVWVSDKGILEMDPRSTWAPLGGHPGLRESPTSDGPSYSVAHLGQRTPRRERVILELERRGISVSPNAWGDDRARILSSSKLLLGVERVEGMHVVTPLRWVLAAAYQLPIVQETHPDPAPLVIGKSILMAPIDDLADLVEEALKRNLAPFGVEAWKVFCEEWTFRHVVEEAVRRDGYGVI